MRIAESSAIVVGGASGLGEATVRALHAQGALVTIADVNAEKGSALASELELDFVACDVREEEQVQAAVTRAAEAQGGLRIAVCCAGTGWAQKVAGSKGPHPLMPFETIVSINLIGTFNVLRFAAAAMIVNEPAADGERGACVNTASIAAFDGQVGQIAYSASKGGVVAMTLPAARDLAQYGIRVNTIAPGMTVSGFTIRHIYEPDGSVNQERYDAFVERMRKLSPLGIVGEPIDQAYLILYLASDAARFCTGVIWRANGGQSML